MILTPFELCTQIPLQPHHEAFVLKSRRTIEAILEGRDPRKIIILGPCLIHERDVAYAYGEKLSRLSKQLEGDFFLVMRTYFEKPRTATGWKGFLYDPFLDGSYNLEEGLIASRQLLVDLTELGVPCATEFLEINTPHYLVDLLTWGCIGARTCMSPPHRQLAASLPLPIGFKNGTYGSVMDALNGIVVAQHPHVFLGVDRKGVLSRVVAQGNLYTHLVLRGGERRPNYDPLSVADALKGCAEKGVLKKIFIDCSHGNSRKKPENQLAVFEAVIRQQNDAIVGLMLESHLHEGISITDPCLSWQETEKLLCKHLSSLISA